MSKNIYQLLNEVDTDLEAYEREELTILEVKKLKNGLRKKIGKHSSRKRAVAIACCTILGFGLLCLPFSSQVYAGVQAFSEGIAGYLGLAKDLADYKTVVNQAQTSEGITVTLNEVVMDQDELLVSTTAQYSEAINNSSGMTAAAIYINGKNVGLGASGSSRQVDDYTVESVMGYNVKDIDMSGDLEVKIVFSETMVEEKIIRGKWQFAFQVSGKELLAATKTVTLAEPFTLPDGAVVTLSRLTSNALGQKIYYTIDQPKTTYILELRGHDDQGNPVVFFLNSTSDYEGRFKLETIDNGNLSDTAKSLILTPYAVQMPEKSGRASNDFVKVGEALTIDLR